MVAAAPGYLLFEAFCGVKVAYLSKNVKDFRRSLEYVHEEGFLSKTEYERDL